MKEFRKRLWYEVALCASFLPLIHSSVAYTVDFDDKVIAASLHPKANVDEDTYTVNFNSISIIEFIRFASKITGLNFVFDTADLQFSVTIVSEEPVTAKNVMAALSQVLRMHDLLIIEQDGNVLITKSKAVNAIAPIVSADLPDSKESNSALVTRVFRIKNANVNSIANIIRPMTSQSALIEVSVETRQLIVTDITANVDQIASLLMSLDAPHTPLEVETYVVKNIAPKDLIALTEQILTPFTEGNALIFVPQVETNSIFIVSTPSLIERAMTIMEDLDIPPKEKVIGKQGLAGKNIFIYKPINRTASELIGEIHQITKKMTKIGGAPTSLEIALEEVQEVKESGSLLFAADIETTSKVKDILTAIDIPVPGEVGQAQPKSTFLIYNPQYRNGQDLQNSIEVTANTLKDEGLADPSFLQAIDTVKWVSSTNSLIFTGDPQSLERIHAMLKTMDTPTPSKATQVFVYKPQYLSSDQVQSALENLVPSLEKTNSYADENLVKAIEDMQWNPDTQSFTVTADPATIERLKGLLASFDTPQQGAGAMGKGFFLYKLQSAQCDKVLTELKNIASKLPSSPQNQDLVNAINKIECIKSNNSLLISGTKEAVDQVKTLVDEFDVPPGSAIPSGTQSFLIYKAKYLPADEIQLAMTSLAKDLQASGLNDPPLFQSISSMRYVQATDSIVFTGDQVTLDKIQNILNGIDTSAVLGAIQHIGNITFLLYRIQTAAPDKLLASLKSFADNLKQSNVQDKELAQAIDSVKYIKETNSLLFTGTNEALVRLEQVLKNFDIPALQGQPAVERLASTFVIYNPRYLSGDELISILCDFMDNLINSGVSDPGLFDAINNLKWIEKTSSLLISGDPQSVEKVQQLLAKFDTPGKEGAEPSIESIDNTSFLVYKLQFHPGNDIQTALRQVAGSLSKGTVPPTALVEAINSLQWIEVTNSLLCTGQQDVLVKLKELIQNLDIPLRQVFIEVLVIQTSFNKATLGTGNFAVPASQGSVAPSTAFANTLQGINATTTPKGGQVPFVSGFDLGVIGDIIMNKGKSFVSLGALVNALQLDNDSTILLNPKIITQDNRQSTIFVGQNVPYTGAIVTNQSNSTVQTANIEYRDVGMSLTITPILGDGDIITMEIVQDISQLTGNQNTNTSTTQLTGIQTSHAHMETRVHVPNNYFVALSGMIDDSKSHFRTAIPCLGGLPVIGLLFSENDRTANKTNIIIFARPQIINTYEEYKKITEHQEWLYKDNARLPMLKEEFDEGIDMVKLPENE
jgi:type II secretory pathway component GspD/PulD (secretin)